LKLRYFPTAETVTMPTDSEFIERAVALRPLLEQNAARTEADRRIPEEVIAALEAAGLFELMVPRRFGGHAVSMKTVLSVSAELAKGCPSTSWVQTLMNVSSWFATRSAAPLQDDIFRKTVKPRLCGGLMPSCELEPINGGVLVTGRWDFTSGCWHSNWCICGVPLLKDGVKTDESGWAFIPMSELTIEDTWFAAGMKGTGSNTVVAKNVFVPAHRLMSLRGEHVDADWADQYESEPCDYWPLMSVLVLVLIGPVLGAAEGALEAVIAGAPRRGIKYTVYHRRSESAVVQHDIADAAMMIDTARFHIFRAAADVDNAGAGVEPDYLMRARLRADCGYAARAACQATNLLVSIAGGSAFKESNPVQRYWRDVNVAGRHSALITATGLEIYGRALLGLEGNITRVI
jgi:3-hydroxy-9,10-secoandrosta-1,3,5(10)-triene-9,17-dione monooxygenase